MTGSSRTAGQALRVTAITALLVASAVSPSSAQQPRNREMTPQQKFEAAVKIRAGHTVAQRLKREHDGYGGIHTGYVHSKRPFYRCIFGYYPTYSSGTCFAYTERPFRKELDPSPCSKQMCSLPRKNRLGIRFLEQTGYIRSNIPGVGWKTTPVEYSEQIVFFQWVPGGGKAGAQGIGVDY